MLANGIFGLRKVLFASGIFGLRKVLFANGIFGNAGSQIKESRALFKSDKITNIRERI